MWTSVRRASVRASCGPLRGRDHQRRVGGIEQNEGERSRITGSEASAGILLLAFLHVLREPLKALEKTLSSRRATIANSARGATRTAGQKLLTLGGHTMTCRAYGGDPTSP